MPCDFYIIVAHGVVCSIRATLIYCLYLIISQYIAYIQCMDIYINNIVGKEGRIVYIL